ncbi:MAG: hypothetical protein Q4C56_06425 [Peptococcaceae bacterium]|nr:hypothetical protein [Peptococcaceae bacterium]
MKSLFAKFAMVALLAVAAVGLAGQPAEAAEDTARIVWDGQEIAFPDQQPVVINGTTFAPSRPLVAAMPGDYIVNVVKDKPWYAVSIQPNPDSNFSNHNNYFFAFYQGHDNEAPFYTVDYGGPNGVMDPSKHQEVQMSTQIQLMGNRLMLPVRALVGSFADISWDKDTKTVTITSKTAQ